MTHSSRAGMFLCVFKSPPWSFTQVRMFYCLVHPSLLKAIHCEPAIFFPFNPFLALLPKNITFGRNTPDHIGKGRIKSIWFLRQSLPTAPSDYPARQAGRPQEKTEESRDKLGFKTATGKHLVAGKWKNGWNGTLSGQAVETQRLWITAYFSFIFMVLLFCSVVLLFLKDSKLSICCATNTRMNKLPCAL